MAASSVFMLIPTVNGSQAFGTQQTIAAQMGAKMVERIQMLSPSTLTAETLAALQLIDSGQSGNNLTFTNTPIDDGARYSPATSLPSGTGTLTFTTLASGAVKAKIVVSWLSPFGTRSFTTGTVVGSYR